MKLTGFLFALTMSAAFAGEMVLINGGNENHGPESREIPA